jgi:prepilin-type N-terminal cleavage/methylation domain-containing protein
MKSAGFTLIELVIVIVILTVGVVGIGSAFVYMSRSLGLNEDLQRSWQIAQECAEHVLAQAREPRGSYASVPVGSPSTACNSVPAVAGYTRTVNVTNMAAGSALCSAGWNCKQINISVTRGSITSTLNFMVVNY